MVGLRPQLANGLHWLRFELEQSLSRARSNLELYLEAPGDRQQLNMALQELRLVRGGVAIIECFGAQLLADEMIELLRELVEDRVSQADEAFAALSGAALQLFDYLDLLNDGEPDRALVLQPLINELRLARGKPVLTEGDLLAFQLRASQAQQKRMPRSTAESRSAAQASARRELPAFQISFLQWFRGQDAPVALRKLSAICARLSKSSTEVPMRDFWSAASALAESLPPTAIQSLDLKRLFGRAGTLLKVIADSGEAAGAEQLSDAGYHLLLHVGRTPHPSAQALDLISAYRLGVLLPEADVLEQVRRRMRGPNTTILDRVCEELRRDFAQVKDGIDLAVRTGGKSSTELSQIGDRLRRLAATFGVLGLPAPQQALLNQVAALAGPVPADWMDMATAILRVEVSIEEALFRAQGRYAAQPPRSYSDIEDDTPPSQDQRDAVRAVLREAMVNLALLKTAVDNLLKSGETSGLAGTPELLHEVGASMAMLNQPQAVELLAALENYANAATLARLADDAREAERFADAIAGVEMFLEALRDGLRSEGLLGDLAALIERLVPLPSSLVLPTSAAIDAASGHTGSTELGIHVPPTEVSSSVVSLGSDGVQDVAATATGGATLPMVEMPKAADKAPEKVQDVPHTAAKVDVIDEPDPEIRAVFVEEAAAVLETLQRLLPQFLRQPQESGLMSDLRRGFHTLKGSGRMVGATRIGEVGWAVERMLNQCLAGALQVRAPVLETLQQAVRLLPGVLENFSNGSAEHEDVAKLIERADELASGQTDEPDLIQVFREDARERLSAVARWLESQDLRHGGVMVPAELVRAFHTLRGAAAAIEASSVGAVSGAIEGYLNVVQTSKQRLPPAALAMLADAVITLRIWTDGLAGPSAVRAEARPWLERIEALQRQLAPTADARRETVDPYSFSALEQVQAIDTAYDAWAQTPSYRPDSIISGLDAVAVAAARVGDTATARVALEMSKRAGIAPQAPAPDYFERSRDIIEILYQSLDLFRGGSQLDVEPTLKQIAALPTADLADNEDPQLMRIFLDEAEELLVELEHGIEVWHASPGRTETRESMRRAAHTLKGSARMANLEPVGLVAQRLEATIAAVEHVGLPLRASLKRMGACVMALRRMLDDAARGIIPSPDAALAALDDSGKTLSMTALLSTSPTATAATGATAPVITHKEVAPPPVLEPPIDLPVASPTADITREIIGDSTDRITIEVPSEAPSEGMAPMILDLGESSGEVVTLAMPELVMPELTPAELPPVAVIELPELTLESDLGLASEPELDFALEPVADLTVPELAEPESMALDAQPASSVDFELGVDTGAPESASSADMTTDMTLESMEQAPADVDFALDLSEDSSAQPEAKSYVEPVFAAPAITEPAPAAASVMPAPVVAHSPAGDDVVDELVEIFLAEAAELVEGLDDSFEAWQAGDEGDAVRDVQRLLHTLKGSARMVGFDSVGNATHDLETRVNTMLARSEFPDSDAFRAVNHEFDIIRTMIESIARGGSAQVPPVMAEAATATATAPAMPAAPMSMVTAPLPPAAPAPQPFAPLTEVPPAIAPMELDFVAQPFAAPAHAPVFDPAPVFQPVSAPVQPYSTPQLSQPEITASLSTATQTTLIGEDDGESITNTPDSSKADSLPPPNPPSRLAPDQAPPTSTQSWNASLFWRPEEEPLNGGLGRRETARVPVEALETLLNDAGEVSIFRSRIEQQSTVLRTQLAEMSQTLTRVREQLRQMDIETEAQINARGLGPETAGEEGEGGMVGAGAPIDRYGREFDPLEMDRYSRMQELSRALAESIGDMASLHTTIDEVVAESESLLQQQSRIASELQQGLMGTLMVPFSRQVSRLQRVVVQTARQNNKQADIVFAGVEAELDRNVLERMTAPLEHLLRNAIVHGIEAAPLREARGKSVKGELRVSLRREGSHLMVEVADDGGGLDYTAIRNKAIQRGLIPANAQLPESELGRFIFEAGFSTARELTQDAGRGIGMDVVASEVKQLGGTIELSSESGKGTRFRIRLPLTMAVSQALLVQVGGEIFAIPLTQIEGVARVPRGKGETWIDNDDLPLAYGGGEYKISYLGDLLSIPRQLPQQVKSVIAVLIKVGDGAAHERRMALIIDQLIGNREIVSKSVGPQLGSIAGVSGATIMPDGRVVLILDVPEMLADQTLRKLRAAAMVPIQSDQRELILVVDDSVTMRRVAERLLTRHGFKVETAVDGMDAIGQLQATTPAVVLLDIEMPRVDGFEVATFMRNNERLAQVPIIMITSRSGDKHRERARSLNVDSYLIKPYQEDRLLAELDAVRRARGTLQ